MRSLRILVNNIELDYVREDMKIRRENNSFSKDVKVFHTTRPVRIIENFKAVAALGELTIQAVGKRKYFPCKVVMGGIQYPGILTQNEKLSGFRKCDVKYGSEVNEIMDQPIADFFPSLSVTADPVMPAYSEESAAPHNAAAGWQSTAEQLKGKTFPEVHWQLPQMSWKDKFGQDLKPEDTYYRYQGYINAYGVGSLLVNEPADLLSQGRPNNTTVIAPQVYLLSPLYYAFNSIGYVITGNFVKDPFFKRLMLLSAVDNMTRVIQKYPGTELDINTPAWQQVFTSSFLDISVPTQAKVVKFTADTEGEFKIRYHIKMPYSSSLYTPTYGVNVYLDGGSVGNVSELNYLEIDGELPISITAADIGKEIEVHFHSSNKTMPEEHLIEFAEDLPDVEFLDQHPTIDFSRYIPEWTVVDYLNKISNTWNLNIEIDDVAKEVRINFNEDDYLIGGEITHLKKSLEVASFKTVPAESYLLKFANDKDGSVFVSKDPAAKEDENTVILENPFKFIPHTRTANLSSDLIDKDGVGLMLSTVGTQFTSNYYLGRSLYLSGGVGDNIYNSFWKRWLMFRLNAAPAVLKGPFSQTELYQISKTQKIFADNQLWMVRALDFKENSIALFETEIEVESVSF